MNSNRQKFEQDGFIWFRNALSELDLKRLDKVIDVNGRPGRRLSANAELSRIFRGEGTVAELASCLLAGAKPVRFVVFNKSESNNWLVPWHQDRVIAVKEKAEVDGYGTWTQKDGVVHCEPPTELLQDMIFARVSLDDSRAENGCLLLAKGSHRLGRVASDQTTIEAEKFPIEVCEAARGDVLIVKALTLHKSDPARNGSMRRAIRVDYAASVLPSPLEWAEGR